MGAEPMPASLEKTPRAIPFWTASLTHQPASAPGTVSPGFSNASLKTVAMASGMWAAFITRTTIDVMM